jgi:hypothetical protein
MRQLGPGIIVAIGFTLPASAQSIKDQLVRTWRTVSCTETANPSVCVNPNAISVYYASGHYVLISVVGPSQSQRNATRCFAGRRN